jgi:hypothetical protein
VAAIGVIILGTAPMALLTFLDPVCTSGCPL